MLRCNDVALLRLNQGSNVFSIVLFSYRHYTVAIRVTQRHIQKYELDHRVLEVPAQIMQIIVQH